MGLFNKLFGNKKAKNVNMEQPAAAESAAQVTDKEEKPAVEAVDEKKAQAATAAAEEDKDKHHAVGPKSVSLNHKDFLNATKELEKSDHKDDFVEASNSFEKGKGGEIVWDSPEFAKKVAALKDGEKLSPKDQAAREAAQVTYTLNADGKVTDIGYGENATATCCVNGDTIVSKKAGQEATRTTDGTASVDVTVNGEEVISQKAEKGQSAAIDEEKKQKQQVAHATEKGQAAKEPAQKAAYAGVDISKAKSAKEVEAILKAAPEDSKFVENKVDKNTVTFTDPKIHKEMEAAKKNQNGKLTDEQQKKLDDNTITHKLDDHGKVTDVTFGKEVKAVGVVDGNVLEINNGKSETRFKDEKAGKITVHVADDSMTKENLTIREPENKRTSVRGDFFQDGTPTVEAEQKPKGVDSQAKENLTMPEPDNMPREMASPFVDAVPERDVQKFQSGPAAEKPAAVKPEAVPAQGKAEGVKLPTEPSASFGKTGASTSAPPPAQVAAKERGL